MEPCSFAEQLSRLLPVDWKLVLILFVIFSIQVYYNFTATFDFFEKKGIPFKKPVIFLGNLAPRFWPSITYHQYQLEIYNRFKGQRFGGMFEGRKPFLYILDPDLIKAITIKDFDHFTDKYQLNNPNPKYLAKTLLGLKGETWKGVRNAITPVFSSARLKGMLPLLDVCAKQMVTFLSQYVNKDVEMKSVMGHYTLEVIGVSAFGVKSESMNKADSHFIKVAKQADNLSRPKRMLLFLCLMFAPKWMKFSIFSFFDTDATDELVKILQAAKAERRQTGSKRNDLLQALVDAAKKEELEATGVKYFDEDTIDGQCLVILFAAYETSSTLLAFATFMMAIKPDLQEKLRAHIKEHAAGKEISYEMLSKLDYLEAFLLETLRMFPPASRVDREVTKPYILPNTNIRLNVGDVVAIPIYGLHMDPKYYPEPEEFRPERFLGDEMNERSSILYQAFGNGPRICIGRRFAIMVTKLAMVSIIQNFRVTTCEKTQIPLKFSKRTILLRPKGVWLRLEKV